MRPKGASEADATGPPTQIWGVLNVTPDSFSDGGRFLDQEAASARARAMVGEGADVIDVGGASSRPAGATYGAGAAVVSLDEELARVLPVLRRLNDVRISIDTSRGEVASAALQAGARIVNDVSMGADPALLEAVARHDAEVVLMHSRSDGRIDAQTSDYGVSLIDTVRSELLASIEHAVAAGIARDRIWIDPGVGFAKTPAQSATLLARLSELRLGFAGLEHRVLVGASRKSFLAVLAEGPDGARPLPSERLAASLVAVVAAIAGGADAIRVHDVKESVQAARVARALARLTEDRHG